MHTLFALAALPLALATTAQTPPAAAPVPVPAPAPTPTPTPPPAIDVNAPLPPDQAAMKAHVLFLASDAMRGREAGSHEFDIAAQYVAAQFYAAGLKPGGEPNGAGVSYLQRVPLVSYRLDGEPQAGWTPRGGAVQPLKIGEDFTAVANPGKAATAVAAPLVFVGYGIDAPQYGFDSYKGVDVRGKIVAVVSGAPASFGGEERAYFATGGTKAAIAAGKGAIGLITVSTRPASATPASARPAGAPPVAARGGFARMTWANPDGTGKAEPIPQLGTLTAVGALKVFGADWAKVVEIAKTPVPVFKAFAAKGALVVASGTSFEKAESSNVVGLIPGSDPTLAKEVVVLSAHLDHIGVGRGTTGDQINNGALDNAIGIASLIEEAKRFGKDGAKPKRTVMFLAVTGEEKGLVGSDWFANHPTVPLANIVADINLDMPILTYPFEDFIVYGAERSTLGPIVRRAAASAGVGISPDPMPEQGIFVRSDHFRFVQKGVPSVFLWPGPKGPGKAATEAFMAKCYHRPCDELAQQPILWDQGLRFVETNYRIAREVADAPARPVWNKGDYFGMTYKGLMAR